MVAYRHCDGGRFSRHRCRERIETSMSLQSTRRRLRFSRHRCRERIETRLYRRAPCPAYGFSRHRCRERIETVDAFTELRTDRDSPGIDAGSGLKQIGTAAGSRRPRRFSRHRCRERIETLWAVAWSWQRQRFSRHRCRERIETLCYSLLSPDSRFSRHRCRERIETPRASRKRPRMNDSPGIDAGSGLKPPEPSKRFASPLILPASMPGAD